MINNKKFAHLHVHTEYSLLDGVGKADQYAYRAKELGFESIAITDHGNVDGAIKWQKACNVHGIKPIFGCELYIVPRMEVKEKKEKKGHILVLAKNRDGFSTIMRMLNVANLYGFYYRPRIDYENFLGLLDNNIVVSTACPSSFLVLPGGIEFFCKLLDRLKDDLYLEMMPSFYELFHIDEIRELTKLIFDLQKEYGLKIIATNDCHYVYNKDALAQEVLLAIQRKAKWKDKNRFKFSVTELCLKSAEDLFFRFKKLGWKSNFEIRDAFLNTYELSNRLNCSLDKIKINLPLLKTIKESDENKFFLKLLQESFNRKKKYFVENEEIYLKRMKHEFFVLKKLGFIRYFLIVWELKRWCDKNDILVGPGRGSVGGSLIAWLLDITMLDPIKYGLLFERFIDKDRADLPDIDIDIEDRYRERVIKHLRDMYGDSNVAGISTFLRMKSKMVLKDVGRVFDIPFNELNNVTKQIDDSLSEVLNNTSIGKSFYRKYKKVSDLALTLEGQIRGAGRHAAGIVICDKSFEDGSRSYLVVRAGNKVCNWDKKDAEYMGMLKLDVLGLSMLSVLHHTFDLIEKNYNRKIRFKDIPLDDKEVYKEFSKGNCVGIFQFSTYGLTQLAKDLAIDDFETLSVATALYRPAPLQSGLVDEFKKRRKLSLNEELKYNKGYEILKDTFGIVVYQEQIMLLVSALSKFDLNKSDKLRKALDKNDDKKIERFKEDFIDGCISNGYSENDALEHWDKIRHWGGYAFNKSHAYAYSMLSYFGMWLKKYYPLEFICSSLCFCAQNREEELINEAIRLGINVCFPKIKYSDPVMWVEKGGDTIYMPLIAIKGIGEKTANKIFNSYNNGFFTKKLGRKVDALLDIMCVMNDDSPKSNDIKRYLSFDLSDATIRKLILNF